MARFVFTGKADDMCLLRSTETTFSGKLLFAALVLPIIGAEALAEDSKLAGAWALVEGKRQITMQGHQEEEELGPCNKDRPYLVIKPDGSFYVIEGTGGIQFDLLNREGDSAASETGGLRIEVAYSRYTVDTSELRLRFFNEKQDQEYTYSVEARLLPDGKLFYRHARPAFGDGEEVVTAKLKRIEGVQPWNPPSLLREFKAHRSGVTSMAVSGDGRYVLSGGRDKTVRLWDVETGKEMRRFLGHERGINSVALSPDGSLAVSGSWEKNGFKPGEDYSLRVWEVQTGRQVQQIEGYDSVNSVCFSPDGRSVLACGHIHESSTKSGETGLRMWSVETGQLVREFVQDNLVYRATFSPNDRYVLFAKSKYLDDESLCLADAQTGQRVHCFGQVGDDINGMRFSPNGQRLLTTSPHHSICEWDVETGVELTRPHKGISNVLCSAYLPAGSHILVARPDQTIRLHDLETGREVLRLEGHRDVITSLEVSTDGRRAFSSSLDGTIRIWKLDD